MTDIYQQRYIEPSVVDLASDTDRLAALLAIRQLNTSPAYRAQAQIVAPDGTVVRDLSPYLLKDDAAVKWDCTEAVPGSAQFSLATDLTWGSDVVALYQLIRSREYNVQLGYDPDSYIRFPLYQFVATTPGYNDTDVSDYHAVTGFDKNYLLQTGLKDAYAYSPTANYGDAVRDLFRATGVVSPTGFLLGVCDYPGGTDWATKALGTPINFTPDTTNNYLDAINQLLAKSGMQALYQQPNGRWLITPLFVPATQPTRWRWAGSAGGRATAADLKLKAVLMHHQSYSGDVWNVPNQWVFVQQGLTFQPIEGSGQYTVNNVGTPPSGQSIVGRVLRSTQYLNASGQADLQKQGDAIVAAALASAEHIQLQTAPWPVARQFDVFYYLHAALPFDTIRRVQAQGWTLPLWGDPMTWETNAVSVL